MKAAPAPAMKSTKAMAAAMKTGSKLSAAGAYASIAEKTGLKPKEVKGAIECLAELGASELKKNGVFKMGAYLNLKLKVKPASPARKGVNPCQKLCGCCLSRNSRISSSDS